MCDRSNSCAPLPATSAYFTTSEPRAKLLTRYHSNHILNGLDGNGSTGGMQYGRNGDPVDSELLIKKKVKTDNFKNAVHVFEGVEQKKMKTKIIDWSHQEELVSRLARKLDVLRLEREAIQEEVEANELLGRSVTSRVACVATPAETNKVFLHVAEVDKITALLLALAGRLARAQNALHSLPNEIEAQEKVKPSSQPSTHNMLESISYFWMTLNDDCLIFLTLDGVGGQARQIAGAAGRG